MKNILITGANGFIGRNLAVALRRRNDVVLSTHTHSDSSHHLDLALSCADIIYHLAGVNRPRKTEEYTTGNRDFTEYICKRLQALKRTPLIVFASSIQAELDNPYGISKLQAEYILEDWCKDYDGRAIIYRFPNIFGKWSQPNYNSVVATFCHNLAHNLPITVSDPARPLSLMYIDDVVSTFVQLLKHKIPTGCLPMELLETREVTLGQLAAAIQSFHDLRNTLVLPRFHEPIMRQLYATYLSFLAPKNLSYPLSEITDPRGTLFEFIKGSNFGQVFVSRTKPGITRGNHYHDTKTEKFLVVEGEALIRFRHIEHSQVIEYRVSGHECKVVDIPPGYIHSIENVGLGELITIFWASEIFNSDKPDCTYTKVIPD